MKKSILLPVLSLMMALSIMLTLSACGNQKTAEKDNPPSGSGASLSSFTAVDIDGNEVNESIFADYDLTMINIWATFCGPCLREMPDLGELSSEYADKGVRIVGIVADVPQYPDGSFDPDMVDTARKLAEQTGAGYLHILPSADLVAAKLSQVSAVPETIFVDSNGDIVGKSYVGSRSKEKWAEVIDELLSETRKK